MASSKELLFQLRDVAFELDVLVYKIIVNVVRSDDASLQLVQIGVAAAHLFHRAESEPLVTRSCVSWLPLISRVTFESCSPLGVRPPEWIVSGSTAIHVVISASLIVLRSLDFWLPLHLIYLRAHLRQLRPELRNERALLFVLDNLARELLVQPLQLHVLLLQSQYR